MEKRKQLEFERNSHYKRWDVTVYKHIREAINNERNKYSKQFDFTQQEKDIQYKAIKAAKNH